jgi:hypothetical protein
MSEQSPFPVGIDVVAKQIENATGAPSYPRTTPQGKWVIEVVADEPSPELLALVDALRGHFPVIFAGMGQRSIAARPAYPGDEPNNA